MSGCPMNSARLWFAGAVVFLLALSLEANVNNTKQPTEVFQTVHDTALKGSIYALIIFFATVLVSQLHPLEDQALFVSLRAIIFNAVVLPLTLTSLLLLALNPATPSKEAFTSLRQFATEYQTVIAIVAVFIEGLSSYHKPGRASLEVALTIATIASITLTAYQGAPNLRDSRITWVSAELRLLAVTLFFWFIGRFATLTIWQGPGNLAAISPMKSPVTKKVPVESSSPVRAAPARKSPTPKPTPLPATSSLLSDTEDDTVADVTFKNEDAVREFNSQENAYPTSVKSAPRPRKTTATPPARRKRSETVQKQIKDDMDLAASMQNIPKSLIIDYAGPKSPGTGLVSTRLRTRAQTPKW